MFQWSMTKYDRNTSIQGIFELLCFALHNKIKRLRFQLMKARNFTQVLSIRLKLSLVVTRYYLLKFKLEYAWAFSPDVIILFAWAFSPGFYK